MNQRFVIGAVLAVVVGVGVLARMAGAAEKASRPLKVVVVTGGHDYDKKAFAKLWQGPEDMSFSFAEQKDHSELFEDISDWKYDVIVFYSMTKKISPKRQENFKKLLDRGVGVVALHHCIAAFPDWADYAQIIGGKYFEKEAQVGGKKYKSSYKHDVEVKVRVEADHPITAGVKDFVLHDETYKTQWIDPTAKVLLSTEEPTSDTALAWVKTYSKARTCYIQLGHGPQAYSDPNYQKLVWQAIRWSAEK